MARRNRPEQALQIALVAHLRAALPRPWIVFHPRNQGERRSARTHGIFKAMGLLAGIPDLFIVGPERALIAIELKAPPKPLKRGGASKAKPRTSPEQDAVIADLAACGIPTLVVNNQAEAIRALTQLGVPLRLIERGVQK